jgi:hypothetical protein
MAKEEEKSQLVPVKVIVDKITYAGQEYVKGDTLEIAPHLLKQGAMFGVSAVSEGETSEVPVDVVPAVGVVYNDDNRLPRQGEIGTGTYRKDDPKTEAQHMSEANDGAGSVTANVEPVAPAATDEEVEARKAVDAPVKDKSMQGKRTAKTK